MVIVKHIDVFPDAGQRRNLGMQRPGWVEPVVRQVPVEIVALGFEGVKNGSFSPHDSQVGPEGLVGAEQEKIQAAGGHIQHPVGREGDPVADGQRPGVVGDIADGLEIMNGPHDVGAEGETDQSSAAAYQGFEVLDRKFACHRINPPLPYHRAELGQPPPAPDIGLVGPGW